MKPIFISEIKTQSPFGFKSINTFEEMYHISNIHGDIISVHTNPLWGGCVSDISKIRTRTDKPILAKGIHETDDEISECLRNGADYVLVVGRIPPVSRLKFGRVWIEPNNLEQLKMIPSDMTAVWNSRDLKTGKLKTETWEEARSIFKGTLIQASNICKKSDVKLDCNGYIVGQNLSEFIKS